MNRFYAFILLSIALFFNPTITVKSQTLVTLNTVGTGTWYPPAGCTSFYVQLWGGGAGGNTTNGGSGGSFSQSTTYTVTASTQFYGYSYTVGAGGAYNADGGDSKFQSCWAYRGLKANVPRYKYLPNSEIAASYYGGFGGGGYWDGNIFYPDKRYGGGGGSGYSYADGGNGGNASAGNNGAGGGGTGNGGNGGSNGSAPGGGGAGDKAGARGEIRIYYYCNSTPGSIGNAHTVPYPRELDNDVITNTASTTGYGTTYQWHFSPDNSLWYYYVNDNDKGASYNFPAISSTTYYRRKIENTCASSIYSNTVTMKVFSSTNISNGAPSLNGSITGFVKNANGTAGVPGITVTAQKTVGLKGSPQSKIYSTVTDGTGKYVFNNLFYGDKDNGDPLSVNFVIKPYKVNHVFDKVSETKNISYDKYAVVPLAGDPPNFRDLTVATVTGNVFQKCQGCLNGSNVPVNTITAGRYGTVVNGGDLPSNIDTATGNYSTTIADLGVKTFTPVYRNHTFSPVNKTQDIQDNTTGVNFEDVTTRTISGKLTDGEGLSIGSAVLEFRDTIPGKNSANPIFRKTVTTDATGNYSISLPARLYNVRLNSFTSAYAVGHPRYLTNAEVLEFFNTRVSADSLFKNIDTTNAVLNLVYHRKPILQIVGLVDTTCNASLGVVFKQNVPKTFIVNVFEGDPLQIGFKVVTHDKIQSPDSLTTGDFIKIWTDIEDKTGTAPPIFLTYRITKGADTVTLNPGVPNILTPFDKVFKLYYTDNYGYAATVITRNAVVTGIQSPPQTFTTVAPEIPQLILHRPPGDASYSFWDQTKTVETAQRMSVSKGGNIAAFEEVKVGAEFSLGIGVSVETSIEASINASINTTSTNVTDNELIFTNSTNTKYSTKAGGIAGSGGDVYIGGAINYKYGISNVVEFKDDNSCELFLADRLIIAPKGYSTTFTYSENHIIKTLMPTLEYFVQKTTGAEQSYYKNQLNVWKQVIDNNNNQKQRAKFVENRSFDGASGGIEVSKTFNKTSINTIAFNLEVENSVAGVIGAEINGTGISGGVTVGVKVETGQSNSTSQSTQTTTGFYLGDQNAGDYYSVDIKEDPVYGTPVFSLVAGTSSCPPEPGAQSRDLPKIVISDPVVNDIPLNGKGFFTIKVANLSDSRETRDYKLSLNNSTSNGVTIRKGGVALGGSDFIPIGSLAYLEQREVLISVEKDNPADKVVSYPNIEFVLTDNCDGSVSFANSVTANFVTPCGSINLVDPEDNWTNTSAAGNIFPITFNGYNQGSIDSVTLQYAKTGTNNWTTGFTLLKSQVTDLVSSTHPWNVSSLVDSVYKLRLRLVCGGGNKIYTTNANGILDRRAPVLVGKPQPADNNFVNGDEISFSYSEPINTSNLGANNLEMTRMSDNVQLPASISGYQNKVVVVPLVDLSTFAGDSIRVIVKEIADVYGNIKAMGDTSYFTIGASPTVPGGTPIVKVYTVNPSILENSGGTMEFHFKLPAKAAKLTRVYFNITGSANYGVDYNVSSDTLQKKINTNTFPFFVLQPIYNLYNGAQGYIYIDSGATKAILKVIPIGDLTYESDETINISLSSGGDYALADSNSAQAIILNDDAAPPVYTFVGSGSFLTPGNWLNNSVPPMTITSGVEVIIDPLPGEECVLIEPLTLMPGAKLTIRPGKTLRILKAP